MRLFAELFTQKLKLIDCFCIMKQILLPIETNWNSVSPFYEVAYLSVPSIQHLNIYGRAITLYKNNKKREKNMGSGEALACTGWTTLRIDAVGEKSVWCLFVVAYHLLDEVCHLVTKPVSPWKYFTWCSALFGLYEIGLTSAFLHGLFSNIFALPKRRLLLHKTDLICQRKS